MVELLFKVVTIRFKKIIFTQSMLFTLFSFGLYCDVCCIIIRCISLQGRNNKENNITFTFRYADGSTSHEEPNIQTLSIISITIVLRCESRCGRRCDTIWKAVNNY